jgi:TrmH family RNA methyltransferase
VFDTLFLAAGTVPESLGLPDELTSSSVQVLELGPGVMEKVATTETPPAVVGTLALRTARLAVLDTATFVLVGDHLGDPGNAGTLLRSAEAAGADAVVFTTGSVDVFNPKVIRASAGALFVVPIVVDVTLDEALATGRGRRTSWGSTSHGAAHEAIPHTDADLVAACTLVVGNEARGLPSSAPVDRWITIPHGGRAESLNVAMAATVLAFEVARQRRQARASV